VSANVGIMERPQQNNHKLMKNIQTSMPKLDPIRMLAPFAVGVGLMTAGRAEATSQKE
jgi:hypothetical protein